MGDALICVYDANLQHFHKCFDAGGQLTGVGLGVVGLHSHVGYAQLFGQFIVVGQRHAGITKSTQRLGRIKTEAGNIAEGAEVVDTTHMSIEEVYEEVKRIIEGKR